MMVGEQSVISITAEEPQEERIYRCGCGVAFTVSAISRRIYPSLKHSQRARDESGAN
jgi:hypothetical protein